jgi:hypothetical protein
MMNCFCRVRHFTQLKRMSIALERFCFMVSLANPAALVLSTWMGVDGCGWPILASVVRMGTASWALI